jgi:hypothetical protein
MEQLIFFKNTDELYSDTAKLYFDTPIRQLSFFLLLFSLMMEIEERRGDRYNLCIFISVHLYI